MTLKILAEGKLSSGQAQGSGRSGKGGFRLLGGVVILAQQPDGVGTLADAPLRVPGTRRKHFQHSFATTSTGRWLRCKEILHNLPRPQWITLAKKLFNQKVCWL